VIHGCYRKTTGDLIVIDSGGKGCEEGWKPLDWNQTGATGATGATGPSGPANAFFADVATDGTLVASSPGVTSARSDEGHYQVMFPTNVSQCGATVTVGFNANGGSEAVGNATVANLNAAGNPNRIDVQIVIIEPVEYLEMSFHLIVVC
jgi:hypothetical protein